MRTARQVSTRNKVMAVLAGGLVLGIGGVATLAVWTDTEWVFGGNAAGTGPGVGTSTFEVVQDTTSPWVSPGTFDNFETNPGDVLAFGPGALALTPGDTVYAPVALRSTPASVAGTLQLEAAVAANGIPFTDPLGALNSALVLGVGYAATSGSATPPTCDLAGFASYTPITLTGTGLSAVPAVATQALPAGGTGTVHYCFRISLPSGASDTLQGRTVAPAWAFTAKSN